MWGAGYAWQGLGWGLRGWLDSRLVLPQSSCGGGASFPGFSSFCCRFCGSRWQEGLGLGASTAVPVVMSSGTPSAAVPHVGDTVGAVGNILMRGESAELGGKERVPSSLPRSTALTWAELEASGQCSQRRGCKSQGMRPDELRVLPFTLRQPGHGDSMSRCFSALCSAPVTGPAPSLSSRLQGGPGDQLVATMTFRHPPGSWGHCNGRVPPNPPRLPDLREASPLCVWFLGIWGFRDVGRGSSSLAQRTKVQPGTGLGAGTGAGTQLLPGLLLSCEQCKHLDCGELRAARAAGGHLPMCWGTPAPASPARPSARARPTRGSSLPPVPVPRAPRPSLSVPPCPGQVPAVLQRRSCCWQRQRGPKHCGPLPGGLSPSPRGSYSPRVRVIACGTARTLPRSRPAASGWRCR